MTIVKYIAIATCAAALAFGARAQETGKSGFESTVTAGMDFATAYVFHGMTYNSNPCLQPHFSIEGLPVILNVWGNYNLASDTTGMGAFKENTLSEVDYFFTYPIPVSFVNMDLTCGIYTYPEIGWPSDGEAQLGISRQLGDLPVEPFLRAGYMVMGPIDQNIYIEGGVCGGFPIVEKLSGNYLVKASWEDQPESAGGATGFKDLLVTGGLEYALGEQTALTASLNYVGQLDDEVLADALYDVEVYGMIGANITF